jgi:hypothetical protein
MITAPPIPNASRSSRPSLCLSPRVLLLSVVLILASSMILASEALATDVSTQHNNNQRTGANLQETILTQANVNSTTFGLLFNASVDGKIDAQPLYLSSVSISGVTHNVLYVVTENDSIYAFDAGSGAQLWKVSALLSGETAITASVSCPFISPTIGITATPVIDRSSGPDGTIYLVAASMNSSGTNFQRLHALDITTGAEEFGGPIAVTAQYPGSGEGSSGGYVIFDPAQYAERAGLLLLNGVIYTSWTSHCDLGAYTGWIIGYNETSLAQTAVLNVTPNGAQGAMWQAGNGLAADDLGNIFFLDANGTFDTTLNSKGFPYMGDQGNGIIRLSTKNGSLTVADYFNPYNTVSESESDTDLGSGGALVLPSLKDSSGNTWYLAVGAGKDGNIYVVNRENMGKFNPNNDDAIYQELDGVLPGGMWASPAFFNGNLYFGPEGGNLLQFKLTDAKLASTPASKSAIKFTYPGAIPSVSANGAKNGIVWAIQHTSPAVLHAYNSANLATELYNSRQAAGDRDQFGSVDHFATPTIVNGMVYVGTTTGVAAFGLLTAR